MSLYRPLVFRWVRAHAVQHQDADDLTQEVLAVLIRELPEFQHAGRIGSFRRWLRLIVANRVRSFWRSGRLRPAAAGGSDDHNLLEQIENSDSDLSREWDRQHDEHVLAQLLQGLAGEFGEATLRAFRRVAVDGAKPEAAAAELGTSVAAVYIAKSRVLRRLRQEAAGLIDADPVEVSASR